MKRGGNSDQIENLPKRSGQQLYYELESVWYGIIDSEKIYNMWSFGFGRILFWKVISLTAHRGPGTRRLPILASSLCLHQTFTSLLFLLVLTEAK